MRIMIGEQGFELNEEALLRVPSIQTSQCTVFLRDPEIFKFIYRWLQGYPVHLPSKEWQIICLIEDCLYFGADELSTKLMILLADERDGKLGRKAMLINRYPSLFHMTNLSDNFDKMVNKLFETKQVDFKPLMSLFSHILPYRDCQELQLLVRTATELKDWNEINKFIFRHLIEHFGMVWPDDFPFHQSSSPKHPQASPSSSRPLKTRKMPPPTSPPSN